MSIKFLPLKRAVRTALLVLLLNVVGLTKGYAYDFSAVCSTGQTLYYNITDATNHYVELTCPGTQTWNGHILPQGNVNLPESVEYEGTVYSVTSISDYAFNGCSGFTGSLTIPNSVTTIGRHAFYGCRGFTGSLTIPNSVTLIGESAFSNCSGFTGNLTIPNSVTSIGAFAFNNCSGFTGNLTIGNSVTSIGYCAFSNCSGFTGNLTIGNSVTSLGASAFSGCSGFTGNLTIGNSVTSIRDCAFQNCNGFTGSLIIPNSVTSIGNYAFSGCSGFTGNLTIGNSVTSIGAFAFNNCSGFTGSLTLPNSVTSIGNCAFFSCSGFTGSLTIPNSVTMIRERAFYSCSGFAGDLTIGNSVTSIGVYAFYGCSGFTGSLTIPNSVTMIGERAFYSCSGFTGDLTIGNSVTSIGVYAFSGCSGFTGSLTIGSSVTSIGGWAFLSCTSLTSIVIPSSVTTIGERAFTGCIGLEQIVVASDNETYDSRENCNAIIETTSNTLVHGCKNTVIPNSVTSIGELAFQSCASLTSIIIPSSVTTIGESAFTGCSGLEQIVVASDNETYDSRENCDAIIETTSNTLVRGCKNTVIPNSVTSIGEGAFLSCTSLTSIVIPNSVTSIGEGAFLSCTSLTSIVIPNSVTEINSAAFFNCSGLSSMTVLAETPPSLIGLVFFNVNNDIPVYVPCGTVGAYQAAAGWNEFTNYIDMGSPIVFADANVKALCVANWDTNNDGELSYAEAAVVTDLGEVFKNNSTITSFDELQFFTGLTAIGTDAFKYCRNLVSIVIPNTVTTIGNSVFWYCTSLSSIIIPNSVTSIGYLAFSCSGISSISIPASVSSIAYNAFTYTTNLEGIIVDVGNIVYDSRNGCNAIIETNSNKLVSGCKNTGIPNIVTTIGEDAFLGCSHLLTIVIPNSVTSLENRAFSNCSSLLEITIPNSVVSMGYGVFQSCSSATSISIGSSLATIGDFPFESCSSVESIVVDPSNPYFDSREDCNAIIESATNELVAGCMNTVIPSSVTSIKSYAFFRMTNLVSVVIPACVASIGQAAFYDCTGLTSMTVLAETPPTLNMYDVGVFGNVNKSIPLYVPSGAVEAYQNALGWSEFTNIQELGNNPNPINFADANVKALCVANWDTNNDGEFSYAEATAVTDLGTVFRYNSTITSFDEMQYFINLTSIGGYAFNGCSGLTSIEIPNSVTSIGDHSFYGCSSLATIVIPNSVTSIGYYAFYGCSSLTTIDIPNSVTSIGSGAFYGCSSLTSITIPNSVTSIGSSAFRSCSSLTTIDIPNSVTHIVSNVFSGCSSLTTIAIPNSVISIGYEAFSGCSGLEQIVVDAGNTVYDSRNNSNAIIETATNTLIVGCKNTLIPNSVTSIGRDAFDRCSSLTSITIPNSVTSIGDYAFWSCSSLTTIEIPNSVTSIGYKVFSGCSGLEQIVVDAGNTVYDSRNNSNAIIETATNTLIAGCKNTLIPNSVTSIGNNAFNGCSGLASIEIPYSVTSIGSAAFNGCSSLTIIEIPNSVTSIGDYAFNGCSSLIAIAIPNSVTSIGSHAFDDCSSLTSMTVFTETPPSLGNYVFYNVNKSIPVYIPAGTFAAYQAATGWNEFTNYIEMTPCSITATANPTAGGTVTGGGTYETGLTCNLTTTPNQGYHFVNWTEGGVEVSTDANYSFLVTGERTLVANFEEITNHWTAANFKNYKAVKGIIYIDGMEQFSPMYEIGAFCGDECRASECAMLFPITSQYVVNLTIGSNEDNSVELITFRIYDHETQQELNIQCTSSLSLEDFEPVGTIGNWFPFTFVHEVSITATVDPEGAGTVTGTGEYLPGAEATLTANANEGYVFKDWAANGQPVSTDNPYTFTVSEATSLTARFDRQQSQDLAAGWNWWSTYIEQGGIDGLTMLENSLGHNGILIMGQGLNVENYYSQVGYDYWWGNLANIQNEKGYKIKVTEACTAVMTGAKAVPSSHPITIQAGWNWIGYPCSAQQAISAASFQPADGDLIVKQGGNATYYEGYGWWPDFNLEPGKSYQYHSLDTEPKSMVFADARGENGTEATRDDTHWTARNFKNYKAVKGIILIDGVEQLSDKYEIGAFCGDECRASVRAMLFPITSQYVVNLTIGSDLDAPNELVTFRIYDHELQEELDLESTSTLTLTDFEPAGTISDWFEYCFVTPGLNKAITGYGTGSGNWYLIASPLAGSIAPTAVGNIFSAPEYDLYRFNQAAEKEWENYKAHTDGFVLANGQGYLYASKADVTLSFSGTVYDGDGQVSLSKTGGRQLEGWNLIGNPFGTSASIGERDFYRMNSGGTEIIVSEDPNITAMEGVFVLAASDGETVTFTKATRVTTSEKKVVINLSGPSSAVIDRAIVRFGEGGTLPKFMIDEDNTKIYVPQGGTNYAVVRNPAQGELPLNFKAAKNGEYTLSVNPEGVQMEYLHLVDNLTGADIDLLQTPDYTFNAKTTDYASRFRLVFSANESDGTSAAFAYVSNGEIVITDATADATLQIVDVTGRVVVSVGGHTRCVPTAGMTPGVYVLRLINGNDVKTQKMVIR